MSNGIVNREVSLGNIINFLAVVFAALTLWMAHMKDVQDEVRQSEDQSNALKALAERVGDLSERLNALSLGNTQRFTSLDDQMSSMAKRFDSLGSAVQAIGDRLTINEAKTQALSEELKTIVSKRYQP